MRLENSEFAKIIIVIFNENDVIYILVEFENDPMSPRESAENGRIGAHGLNSKFLSILRSYSKSSMKINSRKKNSCLSDNFEIFEIFKILSIKHSRATSCLCII